MESTTTRPVKEHTGPENEIRVSFKTDVLRAVERAAEAFKTNEVVKFSAINTGISKLILIVEITKIKIEALHQINHLETLTKEKEDSEGKPRTSYLTAFKVELWNKKPTVPAGYIYQAPYTKEHIEAVKAVKSEVREQSSFRGGRGGRGGRGRGFGGRGGRGGRKTSTDSQGEQRTYRGRGRGGRGRGGENREFRGGETREFRGGENRGEFRENREFRGENREFRENRGENREFRGGFRGNRGGFRGEDNRGERPTRGTGYTRGGRGGRGGFSSNTETVQQERPNNAPRGIPGLGRGGKK
jgi:hypothetical protein